MSETKKTDNNQPASDSKSELAVIVRPKYALARTKKSAPPKKTTKPTSTAATSPEKSTPDPSKTLKKPTKVINVTTPKPPTKIPPTNTKLEESETNNTKTKHQKTKKNMKLPLLRKIHLKPSHIACIVIVAILVIFFGRVALWEHSYINRMEGSDRDNPAANGTSGVIYDGGADVDETEPTETEIANYVVPADMPRYFSIPSLGIINARVAEVGLRTNGEVDVPNNAYMIGWYNGSSLPGSRGTALLDAHGGDLGNGIFRTLPRIQIGAEINVEMGDGRLFTYKVVDTATRALGDDANNYMGTALSSPQPGIGSLTLITCTGEWSQVRQTYMDRFFARAILQ